jgi:predicted ABC-type ATPase
LKRYFHRQKKIDFLRKAKQAGYFIRVIFVCTESPTINAARVAQRVMEGGHDVPIPKIISRYGKSIQNARHSFAIADQVYLYDNSRDGEKPRLIARISEGVKLNIIDESIPSWCAAFIDT